MDILISFLIGMPILFATACVVFPWLYDCYVTDEGVEFRLFRLMPVWLIRYEDITAVNKVRVFLDSSSYLELSPIAYVVNRPFCQRVVIVTNCWSRKSIVITPTQPSAFIYEVERHLHLKEQYPAV